MWSIYGHPCNGHSTNFRILGKYTTYVVCTPPPTSTGVITPYYHSMWCLSDKTATYTLHSEQLTLICLLSQNVAPSPIALLLYAPSPIYPHMKPGVQTIAFFSTSSSPDQPCKTCLSSPIVCPEPNLGTSP